MLRSVSTELASAIRTGRQPNRIKKVKLLISNLELFFKSEPPLLSVRGFELALLPESKDVVKRRPDKRDVPTVGVAFDQAKKETAQAEPVESRKQFFAFDQAKKETAQAEPVESRKQFLPRLKHRMRRKQQIECDAQDKRDRQKQTGRMTDRN